MTGSRGIVAAGVLGTAVVWAAPASAQLDPLLFLKTTAPNIVLAVDTANRMQRDADNTYYDPADYTATGAAYEGTMGLIVGDYNAGTRKYRRKYPNLAFLNPNPSNDKFQADSIAAIGDAEAGFATFYERTKLAVARKSLIQAINDNATSARFSLIKMRQTGPAIPAAGNEGPVLFNSGPFSLTGDLSSGKWKVTRTTTTGNVANSATAAAAPLIQADAVNANTSVLAKLALNLGTANALLPAGADSSNQVDAPVGNLLVDAKTEATRLITADSAASPSQCRNTVVVLVVGGGEGTMSPQNLTTVANGFRSISGRRVPIYVIALVPEAADVASLQAVATESGGQYFEISKTDIETVAAGQPVPAVVRAVNIAVSHAFATPTVFNTLPSVANPYGPDAEFETTSPIVGSVTLKGAQKIEANGSIGTLPDSETEVFNNGTLIPQRSNVLVTSSLVLPGFGGKLRGFRVYKPRLPLSGESTPPSGYIFAQDGTRLWVSSVPSEGSRNVFTVLPDGTMMPFTNTNAAAALSSYLRVADPAALATWVRSQPLGAIIGSTPAILDAPSLDPPPDEEYPDFKEENADRRTLVFVGANDGMLHAFDARTGLEVWAFIPFNLLPKLAALRSGQSIDAFKYFVDSSPKVSDVKVNGVWKTYLFFGQGPGGTFYNALDVTLDGMADTVAPTNDSSATLLTYFASDDRIAFKWAFPLNTSFDHTISNARMPYGDVAATASALEKTVGETWSDPAIGQIHDEDGPFVMLTGSGFLGASTQAMANRGGTAAGTTFYVLDVETGAVHASRNVGNDGSAESTDNCRLTAAGCDEIKNALQMDPVATGPSNSRFISKAYIGDLDGKVWRLELALNAATSVVSLSAPVSLYNAGKAHPLFSSMATVTVGGTLQYIFVGTGSDALPSTGVNQPYSMLVLQDKGPNATKTAELLLETTDGAGNDEKMTSFPAVAGDIVFFTTTSYSPTTPCVPYSANLYAVTFTGGPAYDTNNDGVLTAPTSGGKKGGGTGGAVPDSTKVFSASATRATAPFIVDQHLVFSVNGKIQMFGDPKDFNNGVGQAGVRVLSWRTVR